MNDTDLRTLLETHRAACVRDSSLPDVGACWVLLVSGSMGAMQRWIWDVGCEYFDRRGHTCRVRVWMPPGASFDDEVVQITARVNAARRRRVTLQLLCVGSVDRSTEQEIHLQNGARATVAAMHETYPVLFLAKHRKGWFPGGRHDAAATEATNKQETG